MVELISASIIASKTAEIAVGAKEVLAESLKEAGETALKETPVKSVLSEIENSSLETLNVQNLETINQRLEGTIHPETGVPFVKRTVETALGGKIEGVFPDFKEWKISEVRLPENLLKATDAEQFKFCNETLNDAFNKGQIETDKFTPRQLEQIKNGDKPEGLTWHHNEEKGLMELVPSEIHQNTAHTGGKSIWGGDR